MRPTNMSINGVAHLGQPTLIILRRRLRPTGCSKMRSVHLQRAGR